MVATAEFIAEQPALEAGFSGAMSAEAYRASSFRPDVEYVRGKILERNMGEKPHGRLQRLLLSLFGLQEEAWNVEAIPEQRVQISEDQYRVPDICVLPRYTQELIVRTAPLLCIEILSREDRMAEMQERVDDYLEMGVQTIWIIDPWARRAVSVDASGAYRRQLKLLALPGTPIEVDIVELFGKLDQLSEKPVA